MESVDLMDMLDAIRPKICVNDYVYFNKEDERIVSAILSIVNRGLLEDHDIHCWIQSLGEKNTIRQLPEDDILYMNKKCLLRSLYFRLVDQPQLLRFTPTVVETLQRLDKK